MSGGRKRLAILLYTLIGIAFTMTVLIIIFAVAGLMKNNPLLSVLMFIALIGSGMGAAYTFAVTLAQRKAFLESITETQHSLNRNYNFYNEDTFMRMLSRRWKNLVNHDGYMIAFSGLKVETSSSYPASTLAEYNGRIADMILEKFAVNRSSIPYKNIYYCYNHGIFIFYMSGDDVALNKFINLFENEAHEIAEKGDFRLYIQPSFGIYEHESKKEESVFDMATNAGLARETAEKNFETAIFFTPDMLKADTNEADEVARALAAGEFVVFYQPKFNLASRRFTSAEALVRWDSPTRGLLAPSRFIDMAEHGGLIHKIDMFCFEQVCRDLNDTRRKGRRLLPVSINFSLYEFYSSNFVDDLIKTVEKYDVNPSLIEIEITEGTTGVNLFLSISILKRMRDYGFRILMDDFGVGYSNFSNLRDLPIVVKIDKSFVDNIADDVKAREIVKFMIEFSQEIGLEVIAEGAETQEQIDILRKAKCDTVQGFYYSKALPRKDYEIFLTSNPFEKKVRTQ